MCHKLSNPRPVTPCKAKPTTNKYDAHPPPPPPPASHPIRDAPRNPASLRGPTSLLDLVEVGASSAAIEPTSTEIARGWVEFAASSPRIGRLPTKPAEVARSDPNPLECGPQLYPSAAALDPNAAEQTLTAEQLRSVPPRAANGSAPTRQATTLDNEIHDDTSPNNKVEAPKVLMATPSPFCHACLHRNLRLLLGSGLRNRTRKVQHAGANPHRTSMIFVWGCQSKLCLEFQLLDVDRKSALRDHPELG